MKTVILVAAHKKCVTPDDPMYMLIHAGSALSNAVIENAVSDSTGDNISEKNRKYCELTAVYWAWKNLKADYIGLCHYRRYFCNRRKKPLSQEEIDKLTAKYEIILPRERNYFIETNYDQFVHAHGAESLEKTERIISSHTPEYSEAYKRVMNRTHGHRFNMFIMKWECFDAYCSWLFPILFDLEACTDLSGKNEYDARLFGFVAERLLDVWLEANGKKWKNIPYVFTGHQNWLKKGGAFLYRKFFGHKQGNIRGQ